MSGCVYEAKVGDANNETAAASGTIRVQYGKVADFRIGGLEIQITQQKVSKGWKFAIDVRAIKTNILVSSSTVISDEKEEAQIQMQFDDPGIDARSIKLSLSPVKATIPKVGISKGIMVDGDLVTLNFVEPTHIKDIIKAMAQLSGKNFILSRDIDATFQLVSQRSASKTEAYKTFLSALELAGMTIVEEGKAFRIIKKLSAR